MLDAQIPAETVDAPTIAAWVEDARRTTFALVEGLSDEQLLGPQLEIVNPLLWELGHLAWFQEHFVLRQLAGREPLRGDADALWNSGTVAHDTRWELPLPSRAETLAYMDAVREGVIEEVLARDPRPELLEMALYTVFHEDWHDEAIVYTHQTHGWQAPARLQSRAVGPSAADLAVAGRDVAVPGGVLELGARPRDGFVFDNEKWAHPVEVADFRIAREAVTQAEFGAFVKDGGYGDTRLWSEDGWRWRRQLAAEHPVYWQRATGAGCGAASSAGWRSSRSGRWSTSTGTRPKRSAAGPGGGCRPRPSGSSPPAAICTQSRATPGGRRRRSRSGPTSTCACLGRCRWARCRTATARAACGS